MSWGTPTLGVTRLEIQDVEDLRQAFDLAVLFADLAGGVLEVDLWDAQLPMDRFLVVQFLVGHPTRSRVLVHDDGVACYAVGDGPADDREEMRYARPSGTFTAAPETTIASAQVRTILADFIRTGRASVRVVWAELEMD